MRWWSFKRSLMWDPYSLKQKITKYVLHLIAQLSKTRQYRFVFPYELLFFSEILWSDEWLECQPTYNLIIKQQEVLSWSLSYCSFMCIVQKRVQNGKRQNQLMETKTTLIILCFHLQVFISFFCFICFDFNKK